MTPRRAQPAACRAMTLLELLLAVTILAAMMGLMSTIFGQAAQWSDDNETQSEVIELHRVSRLLRDQWETRRKRQDARIIQVIETLEIDERSLRFLTATPVLFPDWPLVLVEYTIELDFENRGRGGLNQKLVYRETRVTDIVGTPDPEARGPDGEKLGAEFVLIDDCDELRWERFGPSVEAIEAKATRSSGQAVTDLDELESAPELTPEQEALIWRPIEPELEYPPPAARLVGIRDEEQFTWPVIAAPSR